MRSVGTIALVVAVLGTAAPSRAAAAVKVEERSTFELTGALGGIARMVGVGPSEPELRTIAVSGDRKRSISGDGGELVDLDEGALYALDLKRGAYRVTTFDQLRQAMDDARRRATAERAKAPRGREPSPDEQRQVDEALQQAQIDVGLKSTGRSRTINGFQTRQVVLTVAAHARGDTLEHGGGLALTSEMWLAPKIAALKELADFEQRFARSYASALYGGASRKDAEAMNGAFAMHPLLKDALVKLKTEGAKVDGSPILTTVTVDVVPSAEDRAKLAAESAKEQRRTRERSRPDMGKGLGGLLGGIAKQVVEKKIEEKVDEKLESSKADAQSPTLLRMTTEVLRVSRSVAASDVALPPGLRRVN